MRKLTSIAASILILTSIASIATAQKAPPKQTTVYVVEAGKSYHKKSCRLKKGSKGMLMAEAKKKGFKPCKVCKPG